jgi:hypothetical protein
MRSRKYRVVTTLERGSNRLIRLALRAGVAPRAFALLETTGRRTGLARHDALARSRTLPCQWDAAIGRMMASAPLTIRVDLDPAPGPK